MEKAKLQGQKNRCLFAGEGEETDNKETDHKDEGIPCSNGNGLKFECDSGYILYALVKTHRTDH